MNPPASVSVVSVNLFSPPSTSPGVLPPWRLPSRLNCIVRFGCLVAALGSLPVLADGLRAGAASIDITPAAPVKLAGYESRRELSRGVHDPLSARAVAFERNGQRLVLVSVDNLGFYNRTAGPLRNAILEACGLKPAELFLCAIHTHSAPALSLHAGQDHPNNVVYTKTLQAKLIEVVKLALNRVAAAEFGIGTGSSPVGVNRRQVVQDQDGKTKVVLGRNPSVVTDREVQVLKLRRADNHELVAALFAYATHSTSLGPGNYLISGDIHGLAEQFLEQHLGPGITAPGFAGASGDIDPWVRVLPEFRTTKGWVPEPVLMGKMLGQEVARTLEGIREYATNDSVKTAFRTVELPTQSRGESQAAFAASGAFEIIVGRVGDTAFVGLGGEVFNDIGKSIKSASPFRHTFIFTHCNGAGGYVPTRASYAEGGYEVQSSSFAPGAGEMLAEETVRMLRELQ